MSKKDFATKPLNEQLQMFKDWLKKNHKVATSRTLTEFMQTLTK